MALLIVKRDKDAVMHHTPTPFLGHLKKKKKASEKKVKIFIPMKGWN